MILPSSYDSDTSSDSDGIVIPPDSPPARHGTLEQRLATGWTPPLPPGPAPAFAFRNNHSASSRGISNNPNGSHIPDGLPIDGETQQSSSRDAHNAQHTNHQPPQSGDNKANINRIPIQPATMTGATLSAEPQLRDIKKEVTAFVPTAVRRKQEAATADKGPAESA